MNRARYHRLERRLRPRDVSGFFLRRDDHRRGGVRRFLGVGGAALISLFARLSPMFSFFAFKVFAASEIISGRCLERRIK